VVRRNGKIGLAGVIITSNSYGMVPLKGCSKVSIVTIASTPDVAELLHIKISLPKMNIK